LGDPSDVFYLSFDELLDPPADARSLVERRRAERERLRGIRLPLFFNAHWEPETESPARLLPGDSLTGLAASQGVARGRVRVLRSAHDSLEPDEILVAEVTDTGWTPLFSFVAAVVTDLGGMMSHAAVVAREYGVPSVVGTREATRRLADGQTVEVDGTTGVIRALD
jgi:phosphohistidine swiveling domain-containing protein